MQLNSTHMFTGLQRDTSVSKSNPLYLLDAYNIRITARENRTLLSLTNERGPLLLLLKDSEGNDFNIEGTIIGYCLLNNYLVLFTHKVTEREPPEKDIIEDRILRIDMSKSTPTVISLFEDPDDQSLGFSEDFPIEAIGDYENEGILKVYWTDGKNLPRVINIMHDTYTWRGAFDFTPELELNEVVTITRNTNSSGIFPAGVIQYAFTYYNKYGQETNIFNVTPLYYTSFYDRGGSPEDKVSNAFNIKIEHIDTHFDYLRIYSIVRTSLNAVPTVKRVLDIEISDDMDTINYVDTGTSGDTIDPSYLLYVGGEPIKVESICCKDGTLFLGGIGTTAAQVPKSIVESLRLKENSTNLPSTITKEVNLLSVNNSGAYIFSNGLNTLAAGFKNREYYRLGVQFLDKYGKWSEPYFIGDYKVDSLGPTYSDSNTLNKLVIEHNLIPGILSVLESQGYKKHRPLVVFPDMLDRTILALGVINPTMSTYNHKYVEKDLYGQSSWFFRPFTNLIGDLSVNENNQTVVPTYDLGLPYINRDPVWEGTDNIFRRVEIGGYFGSGTPSAAAPDKFEINWDFVTFHSPEAIFDDTLIHTDLSGILCREVGQAEITLTLSDINILTSTPTISNKGSGFIHKSFITEGAYGIISGLFYDDYIVDDGGDEGYRAYDLEHNSVKWLIYPWQLSGSLNNDSNRTKGTRSAVLLKKIISNLRYANTNWNSVIKDELLLSPNVYVPQLFYSDLVSIIKLGDKVYQGNIDTMLIPLLSDGTYFAFGENSTNTDITTNNTVDTPFKSVEWWKTFSLNEEELSRVGLYKREYTNNVYKWIRKDSRVGDRFIDLALRKEGIRMKYKSTPHIVLNILDNGLTKDLTKTNLPIVELYKPYNKDTAFGGLTPDALRANAWIPAGEARPIDLPLLYEWGDTWFSRYDCLKTYPFTPEDENQIVEIGSFLLETHINIDGRYDRNRGQVNNLSMTPLNFNLLNSVYSLSNNFFIYRILPEDYYDLKKFPNLITWSTEKLSGAEIDPWTSITLASTFDMDGSKGKINFLDVWKDNIYCFLDKGVALILFNSRVLIPTSDNIPIEITNSYKVDGKRYISDGVGCINKYSICNTPAAIYFIDSISNHLYSIGDNGIADLAVTKNMATWFKGIPSTKGTAINFSTRLFHDSNHSDLYTVFDRECLCFNEILGEFTSFMSYNDIPIMFNVMKNFYCVKDNSIYKMFSGTYGKFFDKYEPYYITFIVNGSLLNIIASDKIFTNIDLRADRWINGIGVMLSTEFPFDYIRVWNEYLDTGDVLLEYLKDVPSNLKKKFRTWRINIPRDSYTKRDRIRNTWCKVKLGCSPLYREENEGAIELHDLNVTYYI